jgi:hypothetical protein
VRCLYKQEKVTPQRLETTINAFIDTIKSKVGEEISQRGFTLSHLETLSIDKYTKNLGLLEREGYFIIEADAKESDDDDELLFLY